MGVPQVRTKSLVGVHVFSFLAPVIIVVVAWELVSRLEVVNPRMFPPPSVVEQAFLEWARSGYMLTDICASCGRALVGLALGGATGIFLGLATGRNRLIGASLTPVVQLLRPLPPVALIPLIIVWMGIGNTAKIFAISFAVLFPVWMNTHLGARQIAPAYLWSASLLTKSRMKTLWRVIVPATTPFIIAGLRTAIPISFVMVFVSEIAGASSGLGYRISVCHLAYRIDMMIAALAVLAAAGAMVDWAFTIAVRAALPWTRSACDT